MFDLNLTADQIEFRDTVRDFVQNEVKPAALLPARLEPFEKPLLSDLLDDASRMGLRTLSLSEAAGGAGADTLTSCIVLEELAAGDVDIAMALGTTQGLAHALFDEAMTPEQRGRHLGDFQEDAQYHLAFAAPGAGSGAGWRYHRAEEDEGGATVTAAKQGNDWILNGTLTFVANAPIAKLFVVQARTDPKKTGRNGLTTLLVPKDSAGLTVMDSSGGATDAAGAQQMARWHHGSGAALRFENCRVPASAVVGKEGQSPLAAEVHDVRAAVQLAAINLGLGRCAYEAAVDYAKIRIQGGRPIIEHQAIGTILANCAIKLELARNMIWKAAWAADHGETATDRSALELPLHTIARVYTAESVLEIALGAAECFGAMGVMRDMPLQKYVHDAHVFMYGADHDSATKLEIAEALAGFQRQAAA
ncbi:MAG TPA: acyl-CoA dehydrogenase family protein [Burkholderiales bacterium]|nr:acyl-CoA dehydrogenase family protein [Burkholderiales bacterium]